MIVITATGVTTSLVWWNTMTVDGSSLVLANPCSDDPGFVLVVAGLVSEVEAQAMFRAVMERMDLGAASFDARL